MSQLTINKNYSKSFFVAKVLHKLEFPSKISRIYNKHRHQVIKSKLELVLNYSKNLAYKNIEEKKKKENSNIIWIFWWQGENKMPAIVKKCYKSILRNRGKRRVILVTKDNVKNISTIPNYIYIKIEKKEITLTHFSDILRFNLLDNYGGLWVDATIYVTQSLDRVDTHSLFTCSGYSKENYFNISYGRWTGFFIGGPAQLKIFHFMNVFFEVYWKYNNKLIDYFLIDYALDYAWKYNMSNFQRISKEYQNYAPDMFKLQIILNEKYNDLSWNDLNISTSLFKLSYKKNINYSDKQNFFNYLK